MKDVERDAQKLTHLKLGTFGMNHRLDTRNEMRV